MRKNLFIMIFNFVILGCKAQSNDKLIFDNSHFDTSKIEAEKDTLFFDINNDGFRDAILKFTYKYQEPIPKHESGQILALYLNNGSNKLIFETKNNAVLSLIHNEIKTIDSKTFVVVNIGSHEDWNRYFCYFKYHEEKKKWYLIKQEVYKYDGFERIFVERRIYKDNYSIEFEKVSFDYLFHSIRENIPNPSFYETVKTKKAIIYDLRKNKSKKYLVYGDEIEILKEEKDFFKFKYYGKKTIEGWIKKSDVE
ncbi:hypothetical protein MCERE19_01613 [Spirosomataceae bacterium]